MINNVNLQQALDPTSNVAWIFLLTITQVGYPPLYVCNNNEVVTSRGIAFQPFPFQITLPADDSDQLPRVSLVIANVSGEIIEYIRTAATPPQIVVELVTTAYPDIVEKQLNYLKLTNVTYDAISIEGQLDVTNVISQRFPGEAYVPPQFPGLFR